MDRLQKIEPNGKVAIPSQGNVGSPRMGNGMHPMNGVAMPPNGSMMRAPMMSNAPPQGYGTPTSNSMGTPGTSGTSGTPGPMTDGNQMGNQMEGGERKEKKKVPRLSHKKSRNGCRRCKARRVKCDEKHPVCSNCQRHNVTCQFERMPDQAGFSYGPPQSGSPPALGLPMGESAARRLMELRLFNQYSNYTVASFPGVHDESIHQVWREEVPRMALDYEPLLTAIMSFSALHIVKTDPREPAVVAEAHRAYFGMALQGQREATFNLDDHNSDPACFAAVILATQAFCLLQDRPVEPYTLPLDWLHIGRGVSAVWKLNMERNMDNEHSFIRRYLRATPHMMDLGFLTHESHREHMPILMDYHPAPSPTSVPEPPMDDETRRSYEDLASYIAYVSQSIKEYEPKPSITRRLMAVAPISSNRFREVVEAREPRALLILAHYFALFVSGGVTDVWWIGDTPVREIRGIYSIMPEDWRPAMRWPMEVIGAVGM